MERVKAYDYYVIISVERYKTTSSSQLVLSHLFFFSQVEGWLRREEAAVVSCQLRGGDQSISGRAWQNCEDQTSPPPPNWDSIPLPGLPLHICVFRVILVHLHPPQEVFLHCHRDACVMWIMISALFLTLLFSVEQEMTENSPLGDLLRGSVDVSSCQIGEWPLHFLFESVLHGCRAGSHLATGQPPSALYLCPSCFYCKRTHSHHFV